MKAYLGPLETAGRMSRKNHVYDIGKRPWSSVDTRARISSSVRFNQPSRSSTHTTLSSSSRADRCGCKAYSNHAANVKGRFLWNPSISHSYSTSSSKGRSPFLVELPHRSLVAVGGRDASRFLQGLTTNNVPFNPPSTEDQPNHLPLALSSVFLSPQGRILQDVLIYTLPASAKYIQDLSVDGTDEGIAYLIEVDRAQVPSLLKTLKRYKLRSKVSMKEVPWEQLGIAFRSAGQTTNHPLLEELVNERNMFCARDERAPGLGYRIIAPPEELHNGAFGEQAPIEAYRLHRYRNGIAEGQDELPSEHALLHESDLDVMDAVDFRKGCYVGQELVIRTQHTGVVRKRILPAVLYEAGETAPESLPSSIDTSTFATIPYGADIKRVGETDGAGRKNRSAGKWVANVGDVGLALVRLEVMAGLGPTGEPLEGWQAPEFAVDVERGVNGNPRTKVFVPDWWSERRSH
jgi:transferase CAF17, mitochondrial